MRVHPLSTAILVALSAVGSGAALRVDIEEGADIEAEYDDATPMVLGSALENPYTVSNWEKAGGGGALSLGGESLFKARAPAPVTGAATHKYVKITPRTEADLILLQEYDDNSDDSIVLHDHPLDVEVLQEGDYYVQPDVDAEADFSPVYGVFPVSFHFSSSLQVEVLDMVHEPADDGSEDDIELAALESSGLDPDSAYPVNGFERVRGRRKLIFGGRYRPNGCIRIYDTSTNSYTPLRRAKISIGRLIWWRYTHTDDNGCWSSPKKYRGRVYIRAKWRSNIATIRKSWNEMLGLFVSDGMYSMKKSEDPKDYEIKFSDDRLWMKGTVHNGLVLYNDYAASEGINRPISNANVWVWANGQTTASAPMLKRFPALPTMAWVAGLTQWDFWALLVGIASFVISLVPSHLRPDFIFSGIGSYKDTRRIHQVCFHEAGHWSHALQAGTWYWTNIFVAEVTNGIFYGGAYGDGTQPSQAVADQIALVEGWGTLTESYIMHHYYGGMHYSSFSGGWRTNAKTLLDKFDMNSVPMTRGTGVIDDWLLHGLFHDCIDAGEAGQGQYRDGITGVQINLIDDNVHVNDSRELYPIFRYLTSNVKNACDFGNKFVRGYSSQYQDIIDLFRSYGFDCVNYQPPPTRPPTNKPTRRPTPMPVYVNCNAISNQHQCDQNQPQCCWDHGADYCVQVYGDPPARFPTPRPTPRPAGPTPTPRPNPIGPPQCRSIMTQTQCNKSRWCIWSGGRCMDGLQPLGQDEGVGQTKHGGGRALQSQGCILR